MLSDTEDDLPRLYRERELLRSQLYDVADRIERLERARSRRFQDEFFAHARKHCPAELGGRP